MKRFIALVLALGLLCGCGKTSEKPQEEPEITEEVAEEIPEIEEVPVEEPKPVPPADDDGFTDVLFCENEHCTVLVTGYDPEREHGPALKLWVYNRSEEEIRFAAGSGVANGLVCSPYWEVTLGAGEASEEEILWFREAMEENGIHYLQSVSFDLVAHSMDGNTVFFDETVMLHLPGGEGEAVTEFTGEYLADLVREEGYSVRVAGYRPEGEMTLRIHNMTADQMLMFSLDRVVVNGVMCDPAWAMEVPAGAEANAVLRWDPAAMAERGIDGLRTVAGMLYVYDAEVIDAPFLTEEAFELVLAEEAPEEEEAPAEEEAPQEEIPAALPTLAADGRWRLEFGGVKEQEDGGVSLVLWITNNSEQVLRFDGDGFTVNGAACEPYWGFTCAPEAKAMTEIELWPELLQEAGVTAVTEAAFRLTVRHAEDWTSDGIYAGDVRITVE